MENPIVPESKLRDVSEAIRLVVEPSKHSYSIDIDDRDYGRAFLYYLLFSQCGSACASMGIILDNEQCFYNGYYWFQRFFKLYTNKHGYDAGLEQQAFKMLEDAGFDLDLAMIDMIDKAASE